MALKHYSGPWFPRAGLVEDDYLLLHVKQLGAAFSVRCCSRRHRMSATVRGKTLSLKLALISVHDSAGCWLLLALEKWQEYFR